MLKYYFASIVIWFIIIYVLAFLSLRKIKENGWLEESELSNNFSDRLLGVFVTFGIAAVPIYRMLFTMSILLFASMTPEEFEDWRR